MLQRARNTNINNCNSTKISRLLAQIEQVFINFQVNNNVLTLLDNIVTEAKFIKNDKIPLIFIGDCCHDRFSNNKPAEMFLREKLKDAGAIFILGNHDSFDHAFGGETTASAAKNNHHGLQEHHRGQFAFHGDPEITASEWQAHEKKVFQNCYFDEATNTLYIHNGIKLEKKFAMWGGLADSSDDDISPEYDIHTIFGRIAASSINSLADLCIIINALPISKDKLLDPTAFRPDTIRDFFVAAQKVPSLAWLEDIRVVQGHNGHHNIDELLEYCANIPTIRKHALMQSEFTEAILFDPRAVSLNPRAKVPDTYQITAIIFGIYSLSGGSDASLAT